MGVPDPPCSPRHCGARFLRQQEAGASLSGAAGRPMLKVCAPECRNEWSGRRGCPSPLTRARARLPRAARACACAASSARPGRAVRRRAAARSATRGAATAPPPAAADSTARAAPPSPRRRCRVCDRGTPRRSSSRRRAGQRDRRRGLRARTLTANRLDRVGFRSADSDVAQLTERAGFEPATRLSTRTRFPVALLRPLGHLSGRGTGYRGDPTPGWSRPRTRRRPGSAARRAGP